MSKEYKTDDIKKNETSSPFRGLGGITVNGKPQEVTLPISVLELIQQNNVKQPEMVSVQVNEKFINREDFASLQLAEGDSVEFLYFMGGGSRV